LASAFVIFGSDANASTIIFRADAVGDLPVTRLADGRIEMSFPNRAPAKVDQIPAALLAGLPIAPVEVLKNAQAYVAVYETAQQVRDMVPDLDKLVELGPLDVTITAPGDRCDFVSRYFWPANGGAEDPVTGSIHAGLAPYWAARLEKNSLVAMQVSRRTGTLHCRVAGERVFISGTGVKYLEGSIDV
jgi:predicted PhzF superfamily epimerase YddE/YHI9